MHDCPGHCMPGNILEHIYYAFLYNMQKGEQLVQSVYGKRSSYSDKVWNISSNTLSSYSVYYDSLACLIIIIWWLSGCMHVKSHVWYDLSYLAIDLIRNHVRKSSLVYVEFNMNLFDNSSMRRWWQRFGVLAFNSGTITSCISQQVLPNPYHDRLSLKPDIFA